MRGRRGGLKVVRARLDQAGDHDQRDRGYEQVGGRGERRARVAHPAQVAGDQQRDHAQADHHPGRGERGDRRGHGFDPRGHRHGDGEDVVDDQPGARQQPPPAPEAVARDDVGAAAMGVGADHLAVAEPDGQHQHHERGADRQRELQLAPSPRARAPPSSLPVRRRPRTARPAKAPRGPAGAPSAPRRSPCCAAPDRSARGAGRSSPGPATSGPLLPRPSLRVHPRPRPQASQCGSAGTARCGTPAGRRTEAAIDRQRELPHLAWRHAPRPAAPNLPQGRKRTRVELGQLRARGDRRLGAAISRGRFGARGVRRLVVAAALSRGVFPPVTGWGAGAPSGGVSRPGISDFARAAVGPQRARPARDARQPGVARRLA